MQLSCRDIKVYKVELENVTFQHVNAHCLLKQLNT